MFSIRDFFLSLNCRFIAWTFHCKDVTETKGVQDEKNKEVRKLGVCDDDTHNMEMANYGTEW